MRKPRLIFMGTPSFSADILEALIQTQKYEVCGVYTQPPRKSGRGHKVQKSPVHVCAERYDLPVETPISLKTPMDQEHFSSQEADIAVIVAYGLILPEPILSAPKKGCLNIHTSLLPRWRGAAPIQHAIWAGDAETGVCLMKMDAGLDTGPVYATETLSIDAQETSGTLFNRLKETSIHVLLETLPAILSGDLSPVPQKEDGATYASKLTKEMGALDWGKSAVELERQVRAFNPQPGCWFVYQGQKLKVYEAEILEDVRCFSEEERGRILNKEFHIACAQGIFVPRRIQKPGGTPLPLKEFVKGFSFTPGDAVF